MTQAPEITKIDDNLDVSAIGSQANTIQSSSWRSTRKSNAFQPLVDWFYNLPIRRKQLLVLLTAQSFSIIALLGVGAWQIIQGGREQLINQSTSEWEATNSNYGIKINQMGFGFRGQSDNSAIINAAVADAGGKQLTSQQRQIVKNILQNEIKAREIEYATLVGIDGKIIVNANSDRTNETFDPNGLVSEVIRNPQQIKTSEITPWQDLEREKPPTISQLTAGEDVLTRHTITPVFSPGTEKVVGVLVSGDTVDGKLSIVEDTINEFKGGYAAVYKVLSNGSFQLASSLTDVNGETGSALADESILTEAINQPGEFVFARTKVGDNIYTVAARTINNYGGDAIGVLVRGTPETSVNQILSRSLTLQVQVAILVLVLNLILIFLLGQVIARRIESLQLTTARFSSGNYKIRANIIGNDEIGNLALTFNQLAENIEANEGILVLDSEKAGLFQEITGSTTSDENDINTIFDRTLPKVRRILGADRVVIYRFNSDWSGYISHEDGDPNFPTAINEKINDPCIPEDIRQAYINNRVVITEDVFNAGFAPAHEALMVRLQIKSNLVVPIISQGQLFGLLIGHHCQVKHQWQEREVTFLRQIALRFGVILDRVNLLKNQIAAAWRAEQLKEITLRISSATNRQEVLTKAVNEIRPALDADRTIIYEFDQDWKGTVTAESVVVGYAEALGAEIADPCFANKYVDKYQQGRVQATRDIYQAGLTECHLRQLETFQVRANLVAPILVNQKLIGLLITHQCAGIRNWETGEIELFTQLATQVGLGLERVKLIEAQQKSELEQRQARELLQKRALELLMQVDPVSEGDLTIRATVTEDEIGTVADSYNSTIENLRKIVAQVQAAAVEVAETTTVNDTDVQGLQAEIREQVENITVALAKIEQMSNSSLMVAESAEQAEGVLQQAQESLDSGDLAMNRTVKSIMEIRTTVQQATEQMKRLGENTQNISNQVNLIGRFAAQTHMLALKASIEAARAGEQGQGFAVIADEVRNLATQSAQATGDIDRLVSKILTDTKSLVVAMDESNEQVIQGTKLVEETRQNLNQITAATVQLNELVESIASAAFEQSENSEEVSEKMSDVAKVAEKTNLSVNNLSSSFRQLLAVARQLEANVSKFKVS